MQRIHAPFDESTLAKIDAEVKRKGISRAQWLSYVVSSHLRLIELSKGADPEQIIQELTQARITNDGLWKENQALKRSEEKARQDAEQARRKISALEEQAASDRIELEKARSELSLLRAELAHYHDTIKLRFIDQPDVAQSV